MLTYPEIDPTIFRIGFLQIRWYGVCYLLSIFFGYIFYRKSLMARGMEISKKNYEDFVFFVVLGIILGGRLGYVLFYNLPFYLSNPLEIVAVWHGGMSFHGGILGVIAAGWYFVRKHGYNFSKMADVFTPYAAIGLGMGRLGNFINGELFGRVTDVPWAMVFPNGGALPRHPSQLYEFLLEGVVLGLVSWFALKKIKTDGVVFWMFFGLYGVFRTIVENFRQPDIQLGYILFGWLTMGQLLSFLMIGVAAFMIVKIYRN